MKFSELLAVVEKGTLRVIAVGLALGLLAVPSLADGTERPPASSFWERVEELQPEKIVNAACCKTCRKGKACGDSCISKSKNCHKGVGCACDG